MNWPESAGQNSSHPIKPSTSTIDCGIHHRGSLGPKTYKVNVENLLGWLDGRGGQLLLILSKQEKTDSTQM